MADKRINTITLVGGSGDAGEGDTMPAPRVGQTLGGRYLVVEELGRGGMGTVFRARDVVLGRDCALKSLAGVMRRGAGSMDELLREARAAARVEHPAIVAVHDAGVVDGVPFLTMGLVRGRSLAEILDDAGPLPVERALGVIAQVCDALDHVHRHGIVHGDLKPSNVLLEDGDRVRIVDFGLARHRTEPAGSIIATTPGYGAPEVIKGEPPGPRGDLFSAAALLYTMLVGRNPFEARTVEEILHAVLNDQPPAIESVRPDLPRGIGRVLAKGLAKWPERRHVDGASMVRALRQVMLARGLMRAGQVVLLVALAAAAACAIWWFTRPLDVEARLWAEVRSPAGGLASTAVVETTVLHAGDRFWIPELVANRDAYVHVLLLSSDGTLAQLFPSEGIPIAQPLAGGESYEMPPGERWLLDEIRGLETVFVAASRTEVGRELVEGVIASTNVPAPAEAVGQALRLRGVGGRVAPGAHRIEREREIEDMLSRRFEYVRRLRFVHE